MPGTDKTFKRISRGELERRWQAVRALMSQKQLDGLIAFGGTDPLSGYTRWFTDFASIGYHKFVLFHRDDPMSTIEHGSLKGRRKVSPEDPDTLGVGEILTTAAFSSVHYSMQYEAEHAIEDLARRGYRRVGLVNPAAMPFGFVNRLHSALSGRVQFSDETELVDQIKAVKSEEELREIRETCALQDEAFAFMLREIRPGMREVDITSLAERFFRQHGSENGILIAGSARLGQPAIFTGVRFQNRTFARGDHLTVLIELCGPSGYFGELARTIVLGSPSAELLDAIELAKEAQLHSVRQLVDGASCDAVARSHDEFMQQRGLPPETRVYSHGQGYDMVERPLVRADESMKIAANMLLSCHPAFVTPAVFAMLCDNFLVQPTGPALRVHRTEQKVFAVDV